MHKKLLLGAIFTIVSITSFAQEEARFRVLLRKAKRQTSLYNRIRYLDSRYDTSFMGVALAPTFIFHVNAPVVFHPPFSQQLQNIIDTLINATAGTGELLFQLRHIAFSVRPGPISNKGFCLFKASLYAARSDRYVPVATMDTLISIKTIDYPTASLFNATGKMILGFVAANLVKDPPVLDGYTLEEVKHIDSLEKRSARLYTDKTYTDGIYEKWEAFRNQQPDWAIPLTVEEKDNRITTVRFTNQENQPDELDPNQVYAIVYNGKPYVATDFGFLPLEKRGYDFFFTVKDRVFASMEARIVAQFYSPLVWLALTRSKADFLMRIDQGSGRFVQTMQLSDLPNLPVTEKEKTETGKKD